MKNDVCSPMTDNNSQRFRKIVTTLTCLFLIFCFAGCGKYEIKNRSSQGHNIICFGDSITAGATIAPDEAFPALLAPMTGMTVINAGVNGDTTEDALSRLEQDVLAKDPYLVIVELGGNDYVRRMSLSRAGENIRRITDAVLARGAMVALVDMSCGMIMENYGRDYRKIAQETGAIFIPGVMNGIFTDPALRNDMLHPNQQGHRLIADRIFEGIKEYLPRK